jgi:ABC-type glycerol-3-phosphate transport system substrate-binding protein
MAVALIVLLASVPSGADLDAAKRWIDSEFQPSTLSKEEQTKEMEWFIKVAAPFKGMEIKVVSETITTHEYEAKTLAKAFTEITGIKVTHDIIQEGDVVEKIQTQMQSGRNIYDAYINDSDLIGTHFRYKQAIPLTDWMQGEGKDVNPCRPSTSTTSSAGPSRPVRKASSGSCPTSNSPTSTGSATTGSSGPISGRSSRPSTATSSACR